MTDEKKYEPGFYVTRDWQDKLRIEILTDWGWQIMGDERAENSPFGPVIAGPWKDEQAVCEALVQSQHQEVKA
jgi:hypothetical protein